MSKSFMFLAEGFEETEAIATLDIMRRGGINVSTVSITDSLTVIGAHSVPVVADLLFENLSESDLVPSVDNILVFPGGMPGATNLRSHDALMQILVDYYSKGGKVAAICAAPSVVLTVLPIEGTMMTCYDGFEAEITANKGLFIRSGVEKDRNIITSRGVGHAVNFGLAIVADLVSVGKSQEISKSIMLP